MQYQKNISLDIQQHRNGLIDYKKMLDNFQLELYKKIEQCENENCIKKLATYYEELIDLKSILSLGNG